MTKADEPRLFEAIEDVAETDRHSPCQRRCIVVNDVNAFVTSARRHRWDSAAGA